MAANNYYSVAYLVRIVYGMDALFFQLLNDLGIVNQLPQGVNGLVGLSSDGLDHAKSSPDTITKS